MDKIDIERLKAFVENERFSYQRIQKLRQSFSPETLSEIEYESLDLALKGAVWVVQECLEVFKQARLDLSQIEPGHGIGHLIRDYVNGLMLLSNIDAEPRDIFVGFAGAVFHDMGCALIERYRENRRAVRHAEVGALLMEEVLKSPVFENTLSRAEKIAISYSILSHTHYLRSTGVECEDGVTRQVLPYQDLDGDGNPLLGIWFPRWVDRLDCNGPCFVGRHFLTLVQSHKDFDGEKYYDVGFAEHMRPLLRTNEEIRAAGGNRTMLEHINMFYQSQTNNSPYGVHDYGRMVELREMSRAKLSSIITAVQNPVNLPQSSEEKILEAWTLFLAHNIEPTKKGKQAAATLKKMFKALPKETRQGWCNGFLATMKHYMGWSSPILRFLNELKNGWCHFSPISDDVREVIAPHASWANLIIG
jgi:hypothetical protein